MNYVSYRQKKEQKDFTNRWLVIITIALAVIAFCIAINGTSQLI
jgi:hypothetical protein